jgi:hypothetical protein
MPCDEEDGVLELEGDVQVVVVDDHCGAQYNPDRYDGCC